MNRLLEKEQRKVVLRQLVAVFVLSLRRLIRSKFMVFNVFIGLVPLWMLICVAIAQKNTDISMGDLHKTLDGVVRVYYLHFLVFFVASIFGFAIVRQEVDDQTLHYLFFQPIRRWTLVAGKVLAYLALSSAVCIASLWLFDMASMLARFGPRTMVIDYLVDGRLLVLIRDSIVLVLGLLAYGTIAMVMGSFFKSGLYAVFLLGWESSLPYLPSTLKSWTIAHYLHSLLPDPIDSSKRIFEMVGEPAPILISLLVLFFVSAVMMGIAVLIFQFRECLYGEA